MSGLAAGARAGQEWEEDSGSIIGYDDATYRSESASAARNWCLGYMMLERGAFPPCFQGLDETLELYFQMCSVRNINSAQLRAAPPIVDTGKGNSAP